MTTITIEMIKTLFKHNENSITIWDDENVLTLFLLKPRGFGKSDDYIVEFNSKFLKRYKRLPGAVNFFNSMIRKYNFDTDLLLDLLKEIEVEDA